MSTYRISEVAERTGITTTALRYYEEIGVVPPAPRTDAGYRVYDERSLGRLAFVARAKRVGLSLDAVAGLTRLWDAGECGPVRQRMAAAVADELAVARERVATSTARAAGLQGLLDRLAESAPPGPCDDTCACTSDDTAVTDSAAIVCTLDAADVPDRLAQWRSMLARSIGREPIDGGGVRLRFPPEAGLAATVAGLAQAEHACCAFFAFSVGIGADAITLDVRAPVDVEALLDAPA